MSRKITRVGTNLISGILLLGTSSIAYALPVGSSFENDRRCADPGTQNMTHEIGDAPGFTTGQVLDQRISAKADPMRNAKACHRVVGDDLKDGQDQNPLNDWHVTIENISKITWTSLFFVVDKGNAVGNADGVITQTDDAENKLDAFQIRKNGLNENLLEGDDGDHWFEPGEKWKFIVQDFVTGIGDAANERPRFGSLGIGANSVGAGDNSTASIVANCVKQATPPKSQGGVEGLAETPCPECNVCPTEVPEPSGLATIIVALAGLVGMTQIRKMKQFS